MTAACSRSGPRRRTPRSRPTPRVHSISARLTDDGGHFSQQVQERRHARKRAHCGHYLEGRHRRLLRHCSTRQRDTCAVERRDAPPVGLEGGRGDGSLLAAEVQRDGGAPRDPHTTFLIWQVQRDGGAPRDPRSLDLVHRGRRGRAGLLPLVRARAAQLRKRADLLIRLLTPLARPLRLRIRQQSAALVGAHVGLRRLRLGLARHRTVGGG